MRKDWKWLLVRTIISWTIGFLGADRVYRGSIGKLITFGGLGIWQFVDAMIWTYNLGKTK